MAQYQQKQESGVTTYQRLENRISKENAFMALAMWMERSPLAKKVKKDKVSGAVLVTERGRLYALDCTRDGVHALARLLTRHPTNLENSKIFTSRRPCSFCVKLLLQCGIHQLNYLPIEPENSSYNDLRDVDILLRSIRHKVFVPTDDKQLALKTKRSKPVESDDVKNYKEELKKWWNDDWMETACKKEWIVNDQKILKQVKAKFNKLLNWIAQVTVQNESYEFVKYKTKETYQKQMQAHHLTAMAQILAQRSDDPKRGVGAVFLKDDEIVATGWNGFPAGAGYGEFARASDTDKAASKEQGKYSYIIHAEQNAFLMRNTKDIRGASLFITKPSCHECVPLLKLEKVTTCVIGITEQQAEEEFKRKGEGENLSYDVFSKEVQNGTFTCFVVKEANQAERRRSSRLAIKRRQELSHQNSSKNKRKKS